LDISEKSTSGPEIDVSLVRSLLDSQFPQWAALPLTPVASDGTDNVMFRLGTDMCVRLPRVARAAGHVEKEQLWLPWLGALPLAIPEPLGHGLADDRYPWNWSVYSWIEGVPATPDQIADMDEAAATLAALLNAFQTVDAADGPPSGAHNEYRGVPLALRDGVTRTSMEKLKDEYDLPALIAIWDEALAAPVWSDAPVWIHGDIHSGNLLASNGRLCGLIDFGLTGVGDPACDLMVGWSLLPQSSRATFRSTLAVDAATWLRGRGWTLSVALVALAYYRDRNADISERSRHTIHQVLADTASEG
jgi:aminoglycoside phosphotransferase (APT) family kinase protein